MPVNEYKVFLQFTQCSGCHPSVHSTTELISSSIHPSTHPSCFSLTAFLPLLLPDLMFILLLTHPERYLLIYFSAVSAGWGLTFSLCVCVCVWEYFNLSFNLFDGACNNSQSHKEALEKYDFRSLMSKLKTDVTNGNLYNNIRKKLWDELGPKNWVPDFSILHWPEELWQAKQATVV